MSHLPGQPHFSTSDQASQPLIRDVVSRPHSAPPFARTDPKLISDETTPVRKPRKPAGKSSSNTLNAYVMPDADPWRPRRRRRSGPFPGR